jgi:hypothetical protein
MDAFAPFRRRGVDYVNDNVGRPLFLNATRQQLKNIIDSVALLSGVTDGGVDERRAWLSFSLLSTIAGTTKVFESVVDTTNGQPLLKALLSSLGGNAETLRQVHAKGCEIGYLPGDPPLNVGEQVVVTFSGLLRDSTSGWAGRVKVRNASTKWIRGPLTLVVVRSGGVASLVGSEGTTCNIAPRGSDFVTLSKGRDLSPNASAEVELRFRNPMSSVKFEVNFQVFAGTGVK